jgi:hypothetical protein
MILWRFRTKDHQGYTDTDVCTVTVEDEEDASYWHVNTGSCTVVVKKWDINKQSTLTGKSITEEYNVGANPINTLNEIHLVKN